MKLSWTSFDFSFLTVPSGHMLGDAVLAFFCRTWFLLLGGKCPAGLKTTYEANSIFSCCGFPFSFEDHLRGNFHIHLLWLSIFQLAVSFWGLSSPSFRAPHRELVDEKKSLQRRSIHLTCPCMFMVASVKLFEGPAHMPPWKVSSWG